MAGRLVGPALFLALYLIPTGSLGGSAKTVAAEADGGQGFCAPTNGDG